MGWGSGVRSRESPALPRLPSWEERAQDFMNGPCNSDSLGRWLHYLRPFQLPRSSRLSSAVTKVRLDFR